MTIEEAIAHAQETADARNDLCEECRKEHGQLAQWLTELKQLRDSMEKQKSINYELVEENQELINENKEFKRLLSLAVEDLKWLNSVTLDSHGCCCIYDVHGCDNCPFNMPDTDKCERKHTEDAEEILKKMIDIIEAMNLFNKKYKERYGDNKMNPGDTIIAVMKNCTMSVVMDEEKELRIEFFGGKPLFIDENFIAYKEEDEDE